MEGHIFSLLDGIFDVNVWNVSSFLTPALRLMLSCAAYWFKQ
jgi:hypothetical protein